MTETVEQVQDDPRRIGDGESGLGNTGLGTALRALQPVVDYVEQERARKAREGHEKALDEAFTFMHKPEELKTVPKKWLVGFFESYAGENPDFANAFQERDTNPAAWTTQLTQARAAFPEWLEELPDQRGIGPLQGHLQSDRGQTGRDSPRSRFV